MEKPCWHALGNGFHSRHETKEEAIDAALIEVENNGWCHEQIKNNHEYISWECVGMQSIRVYFGIYDPFK